MSGDGFGATGSDAQQTLQSFWPRVMEEIRNLTVVRNTHANRQIIQKKGKSRSFSFILYLTVIICCPQKDFRVQELPLARIKKIMKLDEDVKVRGEPV